MTRSASGAFKDACIIVLYHTGDREINNNYKYCNCIVFVGLRL